MSKTGPEAATVSVERPGGPAAAALDETAGASLQPEMQTSGTSSELKASSHIEKSSIGDASAEGDTPVIPHDTTDT